MSFKTQMLNGRVLFILGDSEIVDLYTVEDFKKIINSSSEALENLIDLVEELSYKYLEEDLNTLKSGGSIDPGSNMVAVANLLQNCSRFLAHHNEMIKEEEARTELFNEINSPEFP